MCKLMRFFMLGKRKGRVISCAKGGVNSGGGGEISMQGAACGGF